MENQFRYYTLTTAHNKEADKLADGIAIGCNSLSAMVPAGEQMSAFCILSSTVVFQSADGWAEGTLNIPPAESPGGGCNL